MTTIKKVKIADFMNTSFKSFSAYDCVINIPNYIDGFKVSQRKCIYTLVSKNSKNTVERFSNEAASFTCYHHGGKNLEGVIVGLAQDYPTSNNVNFLTPIGQFGNILNPAAASGRYISVEVNTNFRKWFKKEDDLILEYEYEDGEQIEPKFFVPIAPTILFNGSAGIGTGYACKILNYNPKNVIENVLAVLNEKPQKLLTPWYNGYKGKVSKLENQTTFTGTFERVNTTTLKITSLPIGYDLDSYKSQLAKLIEDEVIKDYDDNSTVDGWEIMIYANRSFLVNDDETLINKLKLVSRESENITVWGEDGKIKCFNSPEELIEHFVKFRLNAYEQRRLKLISNTENDLAWAKTKIRFINFYLKNTSQFKNLSKQELISLLISNKFEEYDRLLSMSMWNLTKNKIEDLQKEVDDLNALLLSYKQDTAKEMYIRELKELK